MTIQIIKVDVVKSANAMNDIADALARTNRRHSDVAIPGKGCVHA